MAQYEDRWINGSKYTVPVGTRADWKPGQPYNVSTTTTVAPTPKTTYASNDSTNSSYGITWGPPSTTTKATTTPTAKTTTTTNKTTSNILPQFQSAISNYSFPYEQLLRDLMSQPSSYETPSESELLTQARQYAELEVSPLLSAIQSSLASAQTAYSNEKAAIEAAYAGVPAQTQALLDEARRNALESAIARGMGRSGVVDWQTQKLSAPILQQATQSEQEKAAKLAAIANTLATTQAEAARQQEEAESRRGTLQSEKLAELRQQAAENALRDMAAKWGQGYSLAQLAQAANASQQNLLAQLLASLMY